MDLRIPRPEPRRDGDYRTFTSIGYGRPYGIIHLAEGNALDLTDVEVEDCDRLIRAASGIRDQLLGYKAEAAAPHARKYIHAGTCQLCGKPEDDDLHATQAGDQ